jgi:hypothetical protein
MYVRVVVFPCSKKEVACAATSYSQMAAVRHHAWAGGLGYPGSWLRPEEGGDEGDGILLGCLDPCGGLRRSS